jgi:hypothetical protein
VTNATTPAVQPGWYADPAGTPRSRWWDGATWTEHYQEPYSAAAAAAALKAPEGTKVGTVWIWLIALLPVVAMIPILFVNWSPMFVGDSSDPSVSAEAELQVTTSPAYIITTLFGWLSYGLSACFAYLDWRHLERAGVPRPFHFAWVFLDSRAYVIGRAVVAQRRTGRGIGMMWVAIIAIVASIVIVTLMVVALTTSMMESIESYTYY